MKPLYTVAIDPGLNGACAIFKQGKLQDTFILPTRKLSDRKRALDLVKLRQILENLIPKDEQITFVFENVYAFPGQGVVSTASLAEAKGAICGLIHGLYKVIHENAFRPSVWKARLGLGADKKQALNKANEIFGREFKTTHEAEAALLGYLGNSLVEPREVKD